MKTLVNIKKWIVTLGFVWSSLVSAIEKPEGVVYCYDKTKIEFAFVRPNQNNDMLLTVNGQTQRFMTAYSWFGATKPPQGFKFAILGNGDFDPLLVFEQYLMDAKNNRYTPCN
jgi:hypothetical protein